MKPRKITSSFSKREQMRRNPFGRRNRRSTSLRRLYISRSYTHGSHRVLRGGTIGSNPNGSASWRVALPSYARSINTGSFSRWPPRRRSNLRPSGASWAWPGDSENVTAVRASGPPTCGTAVNVTQAEKKSDGALRLDPRSLTSSFLSRVIGVCLAVLL